MTGKKKKSYRKAPPAKADIPDRRTGDAATAATLVATAE